jgi:hypothetical protein
MQKTRTPQQENFFQECIEKIIRPNLKYLHYFNGLQATEADFDRIHILLFEEGFPVDGTGEEWAFYKEVEMRRRVSVTSWCPFRVEYRVN